MSDLSTLDHMRLATEALVNGRGSIHERLLEAEPHFGAAFEKEMPTAPQKQLSLRIGAALVEGGDGGDDTSVAESIAVLDEARASEIASDMLRLYEMVAGIRSDDE